jgi:hypothetical protein
LSPQNVAEAHSAIAAGIDWDLLSHHAEKHGLSTLLYWHLQQNFPLASPHKHEQRIKSFHNTVRNLFLSAALLKILEALRCAGIRALAYKGPALAMLLFDDFTLREMSDVDILIDHASFSAARKVLIGLGYQSDFPHSRKQDEARLRCDCECEFSDSHGQVRVDLHWQIIAPHLAQRFDFNELWDRRREVTLGQKSVPTFSAEDTTLVLAVHGGKHMWQRLSWLADFAESLRQELDWKKLRVSARQARAERMLLLGLALAEEVMEVQLPSEFEAAVRNDAVVQTNAAGVARELFEDTSRSESRGDRWFTLVKLADSQWDGMRSAARFAFGSGPREWQTVRLPDSLFAFYRLLRLAALLRTVLSFFFASRRVSRG